MPRLDSSKGSMPMQVGAVSDGGKGEKGKSKTTGGTRNGTTGTVVSNNRDSRANVHIARSGATNAHIAGLDWLNRKVVQWLAFKNLNLKLPVSRQHNGVHGLGFVELVFCSVEHSNGPGRHSACRQWCRTITFAIRILRRNFR